MDKQKNKLILYLFAPKFAVPAGCTAQSEYQVNCDNYSMAWLYMNEQMLQTIPDQFIGQMEGKMKEFRKQPITCYLVGKEVKGYRLSFKTDDGIGYQIIGYGEANGQPVMVQLLLHKESKSNNDIPEFARRIITLGNNILK